METVKTRQLPNKEFVIVSFKEPVLWARSDDETWMFNPPRRYILNSNQLAKIGPYVDTISDLKTSSYHRQLNLGANLREAKILVERYRDRGIGDLLFMSGPLAYIQHFAGNSALIDMYALSGRGNVMQHSAALRFKTPLVGPLHYDDLPLYNYHWFVDSVTEYDEEPDQLNVYDALYRQLGLDPAGIDTMWKRPHVTMVDSDWAQLDNLFHGIFMEKKLDLRKTPYYVVAPVANANLRLMEYAQWLEIIQKMATTMGRPILVVGEVRDGMPDSNMSFGAFYQAVQNLSQNNPGIVNLLGITPIRVTMAILARATALVCLDSGLLYVAEALRTPAVSIWGSHHPGVRIGYDKDYMDLAIWPHEACRWAPCFAYADFPVGKCPNGTRQVTCEVLNTVESDQVIEKLRVVESRKTAKATTYKPGNKEPATIACPTS